MSALTVRMDKNGRLVLPKPIRERLCIDGQAASFEAEVFGTRLELSPIEPPPHEKVQLVKRGKVAVIEHPNPSIDVVEAIRADREERMAALEAQMKS